MTATTVLIWVCPEGFFIVTDYKTQAVFHSDLEGDLEDYVIEELEPSPYGTSPGVHWDNADFPYPLDL